MGSEQHAASLKNRLYKQKNPGSFTPSGVFLYQFCPCVRQAVGPKALQSLRQCSQVAAGVIPRSGKRGQCQNQQKNQAFRTLCRLRGAAVGASGSGLSGRRCAVRASAGMALPYFCQIVPAACGRPEAARRIISSSHKAGVSALAPCAPAAFPAAQKQHRVLGALQTPGCKVCTHKALRCPHTGKFCRHRPALDPADLCAQLSRTFASA